MPFLTDNQLGDALAQMLKQADRPTLYAAAAYWPAIVTDANTAADQEIKAALLGRGYSAGQITAWDRGAEFNRDLGLFWALVKGAGLHAYSDEWVNKLDRRAELLTVTVTNGGALVTPGGVAAKVGYGTLNTTTDAWTKSSKW